MEILFAVSLQKDWNEKHDPAQNVIRNKILLRGHAQFKNLLLKSYTSTEFKLSEDEVLRMTFE